MPRITFDSQFVYIEEIGGAYTYEEALAIQEKLSLILQSAQQLRAVDDVDSSVNPATPVNGGE